MSLLSPLFAHFDEPFSDSSALPTFLVCKAARENVTVALSGDGGDELFAGYLNHLRSYRYRRLDVVPSQVRWLIANIGRRISKDDSRERRFFNRIARPVGFWGMGSHALSF